MQIKRPVEGFPVLLVTLNPELHQRIESLAVELGYPVQEVAAALLATGVAYGDFINLMDLPNAREKYLSNIVGFIHEIREKINALRPD